MIRNPLIRRNLAACCLGPGVAIELIGHGRKSR
jgi:hypothetical protein